MPTAARATPEAAPENAPVNLRRVFQLTLLFSLLLSLAACQRNAPLVIPDNGGTSITRQVWAVAPLRNETGTSHADGNRAADHLITQLNRVIGLEVLPLNRTLATMATLGVGSIDSREQALALKAALGVDALVTGTLTAFDPYNPPKLGLTLELYAQPAPNWDQASVDPRLLTSAAVDRNATTPGPLQPQTQPVTAIAGFYDGRSDAIRDRIQRYARQHGEGDTNPFAFRLYLLSMDLFTEFAAYQVTEQLILAETLRLAPPPAPEP
ncbi:MAG: hypothetical protein AAF750_17240, partial [Planctomycetota bacterium]